MCIKMQRGGGERGGQRGRREEKKGRGGEEEQLHVEAGSGSQLTAATRPTKNGSPVFSLLKMSPLPGVMV